MSAHGRGPSSLVAAAVLACSVLAGCGARSGLDASIPADTEPTQDASCAPGTLEAYLLSMSGEILTFDPSTLATQSLGQLSCPTEAAPWTFSVSKSGFGYVLFEDWNIYRVDLATLACTATPYAPFQLGLTGEEAVAVSRDEGAERLYVYGDASKGPLLAVTDFTSFVLAPVGPVLPAPSAFPLDMQGDAQGKLYGLSAGGEIAEIDAATGDVLVDVHTSFLGTNWALMVYGSSIFLFGPNGDVSSYDPSSNVVTPLGAVSAAIIGASAAPCGP